MTWSENGGRSTGITSIGQLTAIPGAGQLRKSRISRLKWGSIAMADAAIWIAGSIVRAGQ
jgi:hypothetical protein